MKRKATVNIIILALSVSLLTAAPAAAFPSDWADYEVEVAHQWGLINPELMYNVFFTDNITKNIFCEMVVEMCEKLTGRPMRLATGVTFFDDDWYIPDYFFKAYAAGIISGSGTTRDGKVILGKADELTREEVFKMLYTAIIYCYPNETIAPGEVANVLSGFSDSGAISDWARESAAYMAKKGIVIGSDGRYMPKNKSTIEQGVLVVGRVYESFTGESARTSSPLLTRNLNAPVFASPPDGSAHDIQSGVNLRWEPVAGASSYRLRFITEWGVMDIYTKELSATLDEWVLITGVNQIALTAVDDDMLVISKAANLKLNITGNRSPVVIKPKETIDFFSTVSTRNDVDFVFDFSSREEALRYMTTVHVNVWRINSSGEKYTANVPITVHRYVAGDVISIFHEIYNGPERFPIRVVAGFDWRTGRGEHPMGTALDINPNENYQIFPDGRIGAGSFWKPGENPYSIPKGGDVERAFRNHGWGWGGTDWRSNNDYMHFSFFGG